MDVHSLGACYFAQREVGGFVEKFRTQSVIEDVDIARHRLFSTRLGRDLRLADVTSRRALTEFAITATIGANDNYEESQEFASAVAHAGFDGVRFWVRHDPAQRLYGYALFGPAGAPNSADATWPIGPDVELPDDLIDDARRLFHYKVVPRP